MTKFRYKAGSGQGKTASGVIEAENIYRAAELIRERYAFIYELKETEGFISITRVKKSSLAFMCAQFATVLNSGVSISRAVEMLSAQTEDRSIAHILARCAADISAGAALAQTLERHGDRAFPVTMIEIVRSGEESGNLAEAFEDLSKLYGDEDQKIKKIRAVLIYPVFVLLVAIVCVILVMIYIIPSMTASFAELGGELPWMTKTLIGISDFMRAYWWTLAVAAAVLFAAYRLYYGTPSGRKKIDALKLKLPVAGKISTSREAGRFAGTFASLLRAGVPHVRSLEILSKTFKNSIYQEAVLRCSEYILEGYTLEKCMREFECFPGLLIDMCATGEQTGNLEYTMKKCGEYFDNDAMSASRRALAKLEPCLLVLIAFIAGFIVLSVYLPMFQLYSML